MAHRAVVQGLEAWTPWVEELAQEYVGQPAGRLGQIEEKEKALCSFIGVLHRAAVVLGEMPPQTTIETLRLVSIVTGIPQLLCRAEISTCLVSLLCRLHGCEQPDGIKTWAARHLAAVVQLKGIEGSADDESRYIAQSVGIRHESFCSGLLQDLTAVQTPITGERAQPTLIGKSSDLNTPAEELNSFICQLSTWLLQHPARGTIMDYFRALYSIQEGHARAYLVHLFFKREFEQGRLHSTDRIVQYILYAHTYCSHEYAGISYPDLVDADMRSCVALLQTDPQLSTFNLLCKTMDTCSPQSVLYFAPCFPRWINVARLLACKEQGSMQRYLSLVGHEGDSYSSIEKGTVIEGMHALDELVDIIGLCEAHESALDVMNGILERILKERLLSAQFPSVYLIDLSDRFQTNVAHCPMSKPRMTCQHRLSQLPSLLDT